MSQVRLNKFIADAGMCSRRKADEHILAGDIKVNGKAAEIGQTVDPVIDKVEFKGEAAGSRGRVVYYALYKPKGVISTASDEQGRLSVVDLVPQEPRVYPVGRLDADSEGLMILTNDGELAHKLTHPGFKHEKEYKVKCKNQSAGRRTKIKMIAQSAKIIEQQFKDGLLIDGKLMRADKVDVTLPHNTCCVIHAVFHTGYNRQIRRMCAKIGLAVNQLIRIRIAKLSLEELKLNSGEYKEVSKSRII